MKKLITSICVALGLVSPAMPAPSVAQTAFESVLYASKETGELMPVWERFVNTQFFVVVIRNDIGQKTKNFRFVVFSNPVDKKPYVLVSEHLERLENVQSGEAIKVSGAQLVQLLQPELGIVIGLNDPEKGAFAIPNGRVQWLRDSIQPNG
jgi:hypothetical protein